MKLIVEDTVIKMKGMSEEEFFEFCMDNRDLPMERDKHGNILIMSPVHFDSGNFEARAITALSNWNDGTDAGYVLSSQAGFTLPNGAVRVPDAAWVSRERMNTLGESEKGKFAHICPDFVIEIQSRSDDVKGFKEKMEEYMENGCRLGFLIDPYGHTAMVYRQNRSEETVVGFDQSLSGEEVLPGFMLNLSRFILK